jgi:hypothetical protein
MVPIVVCDQMYSFDRDTLMTAIPKPEKSTSAQFRPAAEEIFSRIMLVTDNAGATDEHRALNYLVMRYPAIYTKAAEAFGLNCSQIDLRITQIVLCTCGSDRGVSVLGYKAVTLLRALSKL